MLLSFSANTIDPEILEATLVGRKKVVDRLEHELSEKILKGQTYQSLLIAPRGSGKTHITKVLHHRIKSNESLSDKVLVAYMNEDERGIANFSDFLRHVVESLIKYKEPGFEILREAIFHISALKIKDHEKAFVKLLLGYINEKGLIILIENLNVIFDEKKGMGADGQSKLRALMHENNKFSILATSQNLFHQIQDRNAPFYNFFNIEHLKKLEFKEALEFIRIQAKLKKDKKLEAELFTPYFEGKVRAIYELTMGNHRLLVIFFNFLTAEIKSDLSDVFLKTMNDLKPYYEQFLDILSPQQQKIVKYLSNKHLAQTGKDISRFCFIDANTLSKQTSQLVKMGYLDKNQIGRNVFYELKEPLMRICFEITENASGVVKLFVDFLSILYSAEILQRKYLEIKYAAISGDESMIKEVLYYKQALPENALNKLDSLPIHECKNEKELEDIIKSVLKDSTEIITEQATIPSQNFKNGFNVTKKEFIQKLNNSISLTLEEKQRVIDSIPRLSSSQIDELITIFEEEKLKFDELLGKKLCDRIISEKNKDKNALLESIPFYKKLLNEKAFKLDANIRGSLGVLLREKDNFEEAIAFYKEAIALDSTNASYYNELGISQKKNNQMEAAIKSYKKAINLNPSESNYDYNLGILYYNIREYSLAIDSYKSAISKNPKKASSYYNLGVLYHDEMKYDMAIEYYKRALEIKTEEPSYLYNLAIAYQDNQDILKAIEILNTLVSQRFPKAKYYNKLGVLQRRIKNFEKAIECFKTAIKLEPSIDGYHYNLGMVYEDIKDIESGIKSYKHAIKINAKREVYHYSLGGAYEKNNNISKAIKSFEQAIKVNNKYLEAFNSLGLIYVQEQKYKKAQEVFNKGLEVDPNYWYINGSILQVYLGQQDLKKSKEQFKKVLKLQDENYNLLSFIEEDNLSPLFKSLDMEFGKKFLKFVVKELKKWELLGELWKAFPLSIFKSLVNVEDYSQERLQMLYQYLKEEFKGVKEMIIPLLYLDVGIRYLKDNEEKALLDLSKEERRVFKEFVLDKRVSKIN